MLQAILPGDRFVEIVSVADSGLNDKHVPIDGSVDYYGHGRLSRPDEKEASRVRGAVGGVIEDRK